jgi:MoaA/NifB/PqqE/SkfB family radical SAM enzyme
MRILPVTYYFPTISGLIKNFISKEAVFPFYASFKITSRCHFSCPFCNMKKERTNDLSTDQIKKILDTLSNSSVLMTSFEGGEPLLRGDIFELLQYARKCKFYLLFTTSVPNLFDYPIYKYSHYIDFLHISIDEGHNNLSMFNLLPELVKLPVQISVQTVVTRDTVGELDWKVNKCWESGANIVIIPAAPMKNTVHCFPDITLLEKKIQKLRMKFPNTIHTPHGYFKSYRKNECSTASIIIASDGYLYYPCHILQEKTINLESNNLLKWLKSIEAYKYRKKMNSCSLHCGWYQYFSMNSYLSPYTFISSLRPLFKNRNK